jgi:septal ring factor EnvC (AmiA/AmiB activator)
MAGTRDRSRSPILRDDESDTMRTLRLLDQIENLKKELKEKDAIVVEQNKKIAELQHQPRVPPCPLPNLTRAALDAVQKWDRDARIDDMNKAINDLHQHAQEQDRQMANLLRDYSHMGRVLTAHGIAWP